MVRTQALSPKPYTGTVEITSGEVAEDLAVYMAESEQTNSAVALGVQIGPDGLVSAAGGYLIQVLLPSTVPSCRRRIDPASCLMQYCCTVTDSHSITSVEPNHTKTASLNSFSVSVVLLMLGKQCHTCCRICVRNSHIGPPRVIPTIDHYSVSYR